MTQTEALRLALEALSPDPYRSEWAVEEDKCKAITAIKAALEAKDEPVAWLHRFIEGGISIGLKPLDLERHPERWEPLYTTPPQRTWVGLTNQELSDCWDTIPERAMRRVEAKLKEKNA